MRRFALILTLFLAAASCAVAQVPKRFVPTDRTGNGIESVDGVNASTGTFAVTLSIGGFPVATSGSIPTNYVTTDTVQTLSGQKTWTTLQTFNGGINVNNTTTVSAAGHVATTSGYFSEEIGLGLAKKLWLGAIDRYFIANNGPGLERVSLAIGGDTSLFYIDHRATYNRLFFGGDGNGRYSYIEVTNDNINDKPGALALRDGLTNSDFFLFPRPTSGDPAWHSSYPANDATDGYDFAFLNKTQAWSALQTYQTSIAMDPLWSIYNTGVANDIFIDGPVSIRDSSKTTQIRIGSRPEFPNGFDVTGGAVVPFPNGLTSQGETVLTSVSAAQGFVTTDTTQTLAGQKTWTSEQKFYGNVRLDVADRIYFHASENTTYLQGFASGSNRAIQLYSGGQRVGFWQYNLSGTSLDVEMGNASASFNAIVRVYGANVDNRAGYLGLGTDEQTSTNFNWLFAASDGTLKRYVGASPPIDDDAMGDPFVFSNLAQTWTASQTFQVTQYFRNIYGETSQDIKMQAASGQALRLSFEDGTTALYIPNSVQPVQFPRGILSNANLAAGTKVQFGGGDASKALAVLAGNPVAGQVDNLMEVQASGKSLPANFNGNLFTIYKASTTYNGYSWPKALARVWDNDAYDANCTGALMKLAWTNPYANGRALLDFTIPNTQTGAAYFWKVGNDYGSTRTFEADCDGNVDSDGVADFDDYTSDVGGPSDHSQGIYSQHMVTIQPPSGVPCISAGAYGGIYTALLNNTGTGAVVQGSNTGGGHFIFGSTQGGTGSVFRGTQNGGGYCVSVDVSGTATGGCAQFWQGGTLSANNNYYAARILRGSDISTYSYLWPVFQIIEQHSPGQTDGNSTFQMYWGNGFHGAGKIMLDAVPDPGVNGLNGQDFLFKYSGRSDYYLDFAGNLRLPGIITSDYSFDSKDSGADTTAPASGYGRRYVKNDQPWWMNDSGGASQITTTFGAWSQYGSSDGESSYTGGTAYQQKLRVTTPSLPAGNYRISWYCELSADASNERLSSRVQIDDTTTIHECSCYVSETYANGGWTNRAGHYVGALGAGVHNLDLDYAIEDAGDTVYIRRARITIWRMP